MAEERAFSFAEAEAWITPAGLNSQAVGFIRSYRLARTPVSTEDGSVSFYDDEIAFESPWVGDEVITLFELTSKLDAFVVRWRNADDGRLRSVSATSAQLITSERRPGEGDVETFEVRLRARALK